MRAFAATLLGCAILAGCGEPPPATAVASAPFRTAVTIPPPPPPVLAPTPAQAGLNIADYMYGPPPHNRIDPRMRCRFDCPVYPANLPPPIQ